MPFLGKTPTKFLDANVNIDGGNIDGTTIGATSTAPATVSTFTSTGIDDNATSTKLTVSNTGIDVTGTVTADSTITINNDGGSSFSHSRIILDSNGASRAAGIFSHNQVNDTEWFFGNPYDTPDSFAINRQATASHEDSTSNKTNSLVTVNSSGRVSIGTTSATELLNIAAGSSTGAGVEFAGNGNTVGSTSAFYGQGSGSDAYVWNRANSTVLFGTNNTERMRIDSSGGVIFKGSLASHQTNAGVVEYSSNLVSMHSYGATSGTGAMRFLTGGGGGSGTSEAMRIDSSGNLLVNSTSAGALATSGRGLIDVDGTSDSAIELKAGGSTYGYLYASSSQFRVANLTANPVTFFTNNTERMRIDGSGNLMVGRTNTNYGYGTAGAFILSTGQIQTEVNGACLSLNNTNGTGTATIISLSRGNSGAGGIASSAGGTPSFVSASDAALKDNIQDHGSELNNVMAIQTRVWDWKDEAKGSGEGVVAQELEQTAWSDLVSDGEDGYKMVSGLGVVETRLIKALQEAVTRIETLEAEVTALKGA